MNRRLTDDVAVKPGASSGIGRATAYTSAETGAIVVLATRRTDRIEEVAARITDNNGRAPADAVMFALTQPAKARTFLMGIRPMSEPL